MAQNSKNTFWMLSIEHFSNITVQMGMVSLKNIELVNWQQINDVWTLLEDKVRWGIWNRFWTPLSDNHVYYFWPFIFYYAKVFCVQLCVFCVKDNSNFTNPNVFHFADQFDFLWCLHVHIFQWPSNKLACCIQLRGTAT